MTSSNAPLTPLETLRHRLHDVLNISSPKDRVGRVFARVSMLMILAATLAVILESVAEVKLRWGAVLEAVEAGTTWAFVVEYLLRLWSCTVEERYRHPVLGRLRYVFSPLALVDLIAIGSYFATAGRESTLMALRTVRLFRLVSGLRLVRYARTVRLFVRVFRSKWSELQVALMLNAVLIVVSSTLLYIVEHDTQPKAYSSIPATMWWAAITLTTVGYGDVTPVTALGKILTVFVAFFGIGLFALPTGIIASGFMQEALTHGGERGVCPMCRRRVDEAPAERPPAE